MRVKKVAGIATLSPPYGAKRLTGVSLQQIKRYEAGRNGPSIEALRKIAQTLHISGDTLLFDENEREPPDDLKYFFEALERFDPAQRAVAKEVLSGLILQSQARQSASASSSGD